MQSEQGEILQRIDREGPILPLDVGGLGIFDPGLAIAIDNANTAELLFRPSPLDRTLAPTPWKDIRKILLEQSSKLARAHHVRALHEGMRDRIRARADACVDLAWLAAQAASHPLIPIIIGGLDRSTYSRLETAQDSRLRRQVDVSDKGPTRLARLRYQILEIRAGRLIARELNRRLTRREREHEDFSQALLGLKDRIGLARVKYLVQSLLIAASTAPSVMSACLLHALATRPSDRQAIRQELSRISSAELYKEASRRSLVATTRFIKEALRLWTFPLITGRVATREHELDGHVIAAGDQYTLSAHALHRCPRYWSEPETFDPDRWSAVQPVTERGAYVPFGFGSRTCVAASLADAQLYLLCHLFAVEFDIEYDEASRPQIEIDALPFPRNFTGRLRVRQ